MLDKETKKKIDDARDILVGKVPVPSSQVEQITVALIYKFMYDMDSESVEMGGNPQYFTGEYAKYAWNKLFAPELSGEGRVILYQEALGKIPTNTEIPTLFRDIFKNAFLPYRDPATLRLFLSAINEFTYDHSEKLGDAFEYLLAILGSQGDAGQFRTPRHIIDFIVALIDPQKDDSILDPACGTAGFLISAYKHILKNNSANYNPQKEPHSFAISGKDLDELVINGKNYRGEKMNPNQREYLHQNIVGYDIAFEMVRLSLVNMYLHGFSTPKIHEYDTLTRDDRWSEHASVILANPPFMTPKGGIVPHNRFTIKSSRSEVLFVDYIMEHLTANGKAGIIVPEGIIFQSGKAYKELRKTLVEGNYLVGVISLPNGVFNPYSGVKTSILWLDKSIARKTDKIIFCKVNNDGYDLGAQRKAIASNDLPDIFAIAQAYKKAVQRNEDFTCEDERISLVEKSRLAESGDYNLNIDRFSLSSYDDIKYDMVKLIDICVKPAQYGSGASKSKYDGETRYIRITDIDDYGNLKESEIVSPSFIEDKYLLVEDDLLFARSGSVGRTYLHKARGRFIYAGYLIRFVIDKNKANPKYVFYVTKSEYYKKWVASQSKVGTIPNINAKQYSDFILPLPPLSVQEEIVAELDSYQKIIDGARMVIDNWKPRIDIDPGWEMVKVKDLCERILNGGTPSTKLKDYWTGDIPWISSADIVDYKTAIPRRFITSRATLESATNLIPQNNVIVVNRVGLGKLLFTGFDVCISQDSQGLIVKKEIVEPKFLMYSLIDEVAKFKSVSRGSTIQGVTKDQVANIQIPLPSLAEQRSAIERIEKEEEMIYRNKDLKNIYEQKIQERIQALFIA